MSDTLHEFRAVLDTQCPNLGVTDLGIIGAGLESLVVGASSRAAGPVAIKVPRQRILSSDNDTRVDTRELLRQEWIIATHLAHLGFPVPRPLLLALTDTVDFLVSEYVDHDVDGRFSSFQLGGLLRRLHDAPPPAFRPVYGAEGVGVDELLADRTEQRLRRLGSITGLDVGIPPLPALIRDAPGASESPALLHMDARPANVLLKGGHIVALLDWSNALVGDPALDVARTAEFGFVDDDFLEGYGDGNILSGLPPVRELLYRLDTAVMLAIVFSTGVPDEERAKRQLRRARELVDAFRSMT